MYNCREESPAEGLRFIAPIAVVMICAMAVAGAVFLHDSNGVAAPDDAVMDGPVGETDLGVSDMQVLGATSRLIDGRVVGNDGELGRPQEDGSRGFTLTSESLRNDGRIWVPKKLDDPKKL